MSAPDAFTDSKGPDPAPEVTEPEELEFESRASEVFALRIKTGNAAFGDEPGTEIARILRGLADKIEDGHRMVYLTDYNGNTVGHAEYKGGE